MTLQANFRQVVYALSDALDLVGVDDVAHGKRVGIMAAECARVMGLAADQVCFLFDLGLLHDIGVSSTVSHQHLVTEFDWAGSQTHAVVGYELLKDFEPLANMAAPIRYHHTRWDVLVDQGVDATTRRLANLILLVDRVDALTAPYYASHQVMQHISEIRHEIESRAETYFDPELVQVFLKASAHEAFWLNLEPRAVEGYLQTMLKTCERQVTSSEHLLGLARIFSSIVDAKSQFTAAHSLGVSKVARALAEYMGVPEAQCDELEVAGLLHDLGKLRVPDEVLDKPAPLDATERAVMNAHSFETMQILRKIDGFEHIASWAADHHEAPGGKGYPYGLDGAVLPLEARILRVADIFQAMVQDRPYRPGLSRDEVAAFMRLLREQGSVDATIVEVLLAQLATLFDLAQKPSQNHQVNPAETE